MAPSKKSAPRSRGGWCGVAALWALCWLACATPAGAQDARALAHAHFERGSQHAAERSYARALEAFEAAYRLMPHPATLYNIGVALLALDRRAEAAATLRRYLQDAANEPEAKRARAQAQLVHLLAELAIVRLAIAPAGARVWVNGRPIERTDELVLAPGTYRVQASRHGYMRRERELTVAAGTTQTLTMTLAPAAEPRADRAADGQLRVIVFPYGIVHVDGEPRGSSPLTLSLRAGRHVIEYGRERPERSAHVAVIAGQHHELVLRAGPEALDAGAAEAAPPSASERTKAPAAHELETGR